MWDEGTQRLEKRKENMIRRKRGKRKKSGRKILTFAKFLTTKLVGTYLGRKSDR